MTSYIFTQLLGLDQRKAEDQSFIEKVADNLYLSNDPDEIFAFTLALNKLKDPNHIFVKFAIALSRSSKKSLLMILSNLESDTLLKLKPDNRSIIFNLLELKNEKYITDKKVQEDFKSLLSNIGIKEPSLDRILEKLNNSIFKTIRIDSAKQ